MTILVLGEQQATNVAGYVAALSGRRVHLSQASPVKLSSVTMGGDTHEVDVVHGLPEGPITAAIVVTESRLLKQVLKPLAHRLAGVPLLLAPGGFAGALRVLEWFREWGVEAPRVAESTGFPVSGTRSGAVLHCHTVKHRLPMAAERADETAQLHEIFVQLLPELVPSDLVTTSLTNTNHAIHPPIVMLNAVRIQNGESFIFYRSGISQAAGRLIDALDAERLQLVDRLGGEATDIQQWFLRFYGPEGMAGTGVIECLKTFEPFAESAAPTTLDYRYLIDDVPHGIAQWSALAHALSIPVPQIDALLAILGTIAPDLSLEADPQGAHLFQSYLGALEGVTR